MQRMKLVALLLAVFAAGCAQVPTQTAGSTTPTLSAPEARSQYQQGLANYRESRFEAAQSNLGAAIASGTLSPDEANNARKHLAFIHCAAGRELPCREQFQAILQADPGFDLQPAESGHPQWGPVWRSVKGTVEEKRALSKASGTNATPAQQKLAEGIKNYDAGRYKDALGALQAALKAGLPAGADEIRAHKYSAFAYCLTGRAKQCRAEFKMIFAIDPAFDLLPSESGHPAWSSAYRSEKAAAAKKTNSSSADKKQAPAR
ncbi:TssQ family T6SS-associated lipoprotein [Noviherbaspirillum sp. ST9]|uniref:TssQ family T6SS-associated lipoprotein n=1 Tax=Noviherbaspirillum sp. ST9 TaxID=3401606 RepID=UPI003B587F0F